MHRSGENPVELLLWSQQRSLTEVRIQVEQLKRKAKLRKTGKKWTAEKKSKEKENADTEHGINNENLYKLGRELLEKQDNERRKAMDGIHL